MRLKSLAYSSKDDTHAHRHGMNKLDPQLSEVLVATKLSLNSDLNCTVLVRQQQEYLQN